MDETALKLKPLVDSPRRQLHVEVDRGMAGAAQTCRAVRHGGALPGHYRIGSEVETVDEVLAAGVSLHGAKEEHLSARSAATMFFATHRDA